MHFIVVTFYNKGRSQGGSVICRSLFRIIQIIVWEASINLRISGKSVT